MYVHIEAIEKQHMCLTQSNLLPLRTLAVSNFDDTL